MRNTRLNTTSFDLEQVINTLPVKEHGPRGVLARALIRSWERGFKPYTVQQIHLHAKDLQLSPRAVGIIRQCVGTVKEEN